MVEVRVGRSRQVPVLLDTGSVGLHIFAPAVSTSAGSGVRVSQTAQSITSSGGTVYRGLEAYAVITVGSRATASIIPFALVEQASYTASKPDCPTAKGMSEEIGAGEYGILGIGLTKAKTGLTSPLLAMPGALGRTWSIHFEEAQAPSCSAPACPRPRTKRRFISAQKVGPPWAARGPTHELFCVSWLGPHADARRRCSTPGHSRCN